MSRKALGRGLGALLSSDRIVEQSQTEGFEIPIDSIDPGSMQPRVHFDDASLAELADSIRAHGVVQPVIVRQRGDRYELVAGERRWRAARLAGLTSIAAVIKEVPDEELLEIALIENIQREDLNPIEEAQAYRKLLEAVGLTQESLASRVGRDRSYITNYLRLLRLPDDLQQLIIDKKLSTGHARTLLALPHIDQQRRVARQVIQMQMSVRATETTVRRVLDSSSSDGKPARPAPIRDANTRAAEDKLRRALGTQVKILQAADGRGKIEISFFDASDLDRLYSQLTSTRV